jgi:hypothetical protein
VVESKEIEVKKLGDVKGGGVEGSRGQEIEKRRGKEMERWRSEELKVIYYGDAKHAIGHTNVHIAARTCGLAKKRLLLLLHCERRSAQTLHLFLRQSHLSLHKNLALRSVLLGFCQFFFSVVSLSTGLEGV